MSPLASPYLFGALAIHAPDDPWIAPGAHLHLHLSADLDHPLHPFVALPIRFAHERELFPLDVKWVNERGETFSHPFHTEVTGPVTGTVTGAFGEPREGRWCFIKLEGDDELVVEWLDRSILPWGSPVLGTRSRPPYSFGGYNLSRLRVSGIGRVEAVFGMLEDDMFSDDLGAPIVFGLPVDGSSFYAIQPGGSPFDEARERLFAGQTRRLGPPDKPDGNFVPLQAGEDDARVQAFAPDHIDPWIKTCFLGENLPPMEGQVGVTPFHVDLDSWSMVLTMATDPRIARYLGLATVVEPQDIEEGLPLAWLVAGHFPVSGRVRKKYSRAGHRFVPSGASEAIDRLIDSMLHDLVPGVEDVRAEFSPEAIQAQEWEFLTLITLAVTAAKAPPDPPPALALGLARSGSWNANTADPTWTQSIALLGQPASGSVGFARIEPQGNLSLHQQFAGFGAVPLLAQWSKQGPAPSARLDPAIQVTTGGILWTPPMVTDAKVPENDLGAAWRIWQSDKFGRWSEPADISAPLPERPAPPAPAPELHFTPRSIPGTAPISPGNIDIRVDLPKPGSLPPGARPIAAVEIKMDGVSIGQMPVAVGQEVVSLGQPAPNLLPGQSRTVVITAKFRDTGDFPSMDGIARLDVFDPRPISANPTSPNLLWTGRLDATGKAELAITWPAVDPNIGYRVYLGDERRLAVALAIPDDVLHGTDQVPPHRLHSTRALAADKICEAASAGRLREKALFTLLTEQPLKPVNGNVRFQFQLPGGLQGTQFLRIVPVTASGAEPPFESCGLVPIAVPRAEYPPSPTIQVTRTPEGVRVRVLAYGLTQETLARFGYPGTGFVPEFRVRRTRGQLADPVYLPIVRQGDLTPPPEGSEPDTPWTAEFIEPEFALPAFVTHTWLAEVCYPPEPARAENLADPNPMVVRSLWGSPGVPIPSLWSPVSLPVSLTPVPAGVPEAPAQVRAERQLDGNIHLKVDHHLHPHPKTIAPYQIGIWKWVSNAGVTHLIDAPAMEMVPPRSDMETIVETAADVVAYSVAVIDPLGRMGTLTRVDVVDAPPPTVPVPNLLGVLLEEAFQILRDSGLFPVLIGDMPSHPETALVRSLEPGPGEQALVGSQIFVRARDEGEMNGPPDGWA